SVDMAVGNRGSTRQRIFLWLRVGSLNDLPRLQIQFYRFPIPADVPLKFALETFLKVLKQLGVRQLLVAQCRKHRLLDGLVFLLADVLASFAPGMLGEYFSFRHLPSPCRNARLQHWHSPN